MCAAQAAEAEDPNALERKRKAELERWKWEQQVTGAATSNANFAVSGGGARSKGGGCDWPRVLAGTSVAAPDQVFRLAFFVPSCTFVLPDATAVL